MCELHIRAREAADLRVLSAVADQFGSDVFFLFVLSNGACMHCMLPHDMSGRCTCCSLVLRYTPLIASRKFSVTAASSLLLLHALRSIPRFRAEALVWSIPPWDSQNALSLR